jgi:nucleoid-associated protein YgaU
VLADVAEENLLEQAKQLWQQGVLEWNAGNYGPAEEYFLEARRLAEAYKSQSVNPDYPVYVVRLIPERRDCLWRIAEYDFIYGNPYLWPKIWRRNRKLIQHPDLIYPGWKLVIPPR